jgi:hypothetical protein
MKLRPELEALLVFGAIMIALGWPSLSLRDATGSALVSVVAPPLSAVRFGDGGRAELRATPAVQSRRAGEHVSSDALLILRIEGMHGELVTSMSVRRDLYLPLLTFCAAAWAPPIGTRRRWLAFALGLPMAALGCFGFLCLTVRWLFAHQAPQLYGGSEHDLTLLDGLVGAFLMPSSVRFALPLLLATLCVWLSTHLTTRA